MLPCDFITLQDLPSQCSELVADVHVAYRAKGMVRQPRHAQARLSVSMAVNEIAVAHESFCKVSSNFSQPKVRSPGRRTGTGVKMRCPDWPKTPLTRETVWLTWADLSSVTSVTGDDAGDNLNHRNARPNQYAYFRTWNRTSVLG